MVFSTLKEKRYMVAYSEAVYETSCAMPDNSRFERAAIVCSYGSQGFQRFMYRQAKEIRQPILLTELLFRLSLIFFRLTFGMLFEMHATRKKEEKEEESE